MKYARSIAQGIFVDNLSVPTSNRPFRVEYGNQDVVSLEHGPLPKVHDRTRRRTAEEPSASQARRSCPWFRTPRNGAHPLGRGRSARSRSTWTPRELGQRLVGLSLEAFLERGFVDLELIRVQILRGEVQQDLGIAAGLLLTYDRQC